MEQIVKVSRRENIFSPLQILLDPSLKRPRVLGAQSQIWNVVRVRRNSIERLFQTRLFERRGIREPQPRSRKNLAPPQGLPRERNPRHSNVAESAVMHEPPAHNRRQRLPRHRLLRVDVITQPLAVILRPVGKVSHKPVLVLHAISESRVRPASFRIVTLILKTRAIDVVDLIPSKIKLPVGRTDATRVSWIQLVIPV